MLVDRGIKESDDMILVKLESMASFCDDTPATEAKR